MLPWLLSFLLVSRAPGLPLLWPSFSSFPFGTCSSVSAYQVFEEARITPEHLLLQLFSVFLSVLGGLLLLLLLWGHGCSEPFGTQTSDLPSPPPLEVLTAGPLSRAGGVAMVD